MAVGWAFGPITIQLMDDLGRPQGRYTEVFMLISLLEVCQEWGVNKGGTFFLQIFFIFINDEMYNTNLDRRNLKHQTLTQRPG